MRLFIAEKPSLAKTIAAGLGGGKRSDGCIECGNDIITWCFGHMYELAGPEDYKDEWKAWAMEALPMIPDEWKKLPRKDAKKQIAIIKKLLKKATEVVNAGDPDREGQLLVDEVIEELSWKGTTSRIWLDALDDAAVQKALANIKPNSEYKGLSQSAEARGYADWTVGLNLTRAYTVKGREAGYDGVLTIGRVQTPTLALIVNRDLEIEHFKPIPYFVVMGQFESEGGCYRGKWQPGDDDTDANGYVTDKIKSDNVCAAVQGKAGVITKVITKKNKKTPELPFSLSALQAYANKKWGYGAKETLDIAQSLYEGHKATTYPRTDCRYLSEGQRAEVNATMKAVAKADDSMEGFVEACNFDQKTKMFNDKKITAHTAIIPTKTAPDLSKMKSKELDIYNAIRRRYIAQFLPVYEFESTSITTKCEGFVFKTTGTKTINLGWRVIEGEKTDGKEEKELPALSESQDVKMKTAVTEAKQTKPPEKFTEGLVITAMAGISKFVEDPEVKKRLKETAGIGTEATRGAILENLKKRNYLAAKGKTIVSTETARQLISILPEGLTSPATTAMWEMALEGISTGKVSFDEFLSKQNAWVGQEIQRAKTADLKAVASSGTAAPSRKKGKAKGNKRKKSK